MAAPRREFLAFIADEATGEAARLAAARLGWPEDGVIPGSVDTARSFLQSAPAPGVLLVDVGDSGDVLADMDALAEVCEPRTRVVAVGRANDVALYRALVGMGASDYLVKPVTAELLVEALRRAEVRERPVAETAAGGAFALIGAKGGVGTTSLAASLAWGLAHARQQRAVLLDLDLQFGAGALSLDLEPGRGLRELLANPARIDSLLIGSAASAESPRLRVLGAEEPLDEEVGLRAEGLETLLDALSDDADAVVIDVPRRLDPAGRAALAAADVAAVVTDLSLPAMRDARRLLELLGRVRGERETLVVGNRIGGVPGEVPRADFEQGIGRKLDFAVPADPKAAAAAAEHGKALLAVARQGPAAAELQRLLERFAGEAPAAPAKDTWFKRVLRR